MRITDTADDLIPGLARLQRVLLAAGAFGLVLTALVGLVEPTQFFQSYLTGYMLSLGVTLGCLALGMVHELSGGAWGVVIRRPIDAASRTLPAMALLFVPILLGMSHLYPWARPEVMAQDEGLQAKRLYLNVPFFIVRAAVYFAVWNGIAYALSRLLAEQDRTGDPRLARRMQMLSAGGLVAYGLTMTFAAFDWLMSLEPHWFSTIYGVLIIGGQGLSALAFLIVVLAWLARHPPFDRIVVPAHYHDLGNLLLAFVMLWAYFSFSQYLIIWAGNLPREIAWYAHRLQTGWRFVGVILVLFHFAVPFALLLSRTVKQHARLIAGLAVAIILVRFVDLFWLIAPEFHTRGLAIGWLDLAVPFSLGLIWLGIFMSHLRRCPLLPLRDPEFASAIEQLMNAPVERPSTAG